MVTLVAALKTDSLKCGEPFSLDDETYSQSHTFFVGEYKGLSPTASPTYVPTLGPTPLPSPVPTRFPDVPDLSAIWAAASVVGLVGSVYCLFAENRKAALRRVPVLGPWLTGGAGAGTGAGGAYASSGSRGIPLDGLRDTVADVESLGIVSAYIIRRDELVLDDRAFAQGAGGQVFRGTYHGTVVAAKAVFSQTLAADTEEFSREVKMLAALHHPHIVTFYGVSAERAGRGDAANPLASSTLYIVEEFCPGGNLEVYCCRTHPDFTPALFARIVQELLAAVRCGRAYYPPPPPAETKYDEKAALPALGANSV